MALSPRDIELINLHLETRLSTADKQEFDQRMQDAAFANEVSFQQDLSAAQTEVSREDLRAQFDVWDNQQNRQRRQLLAWKAAASVLIICTISTIFYLWNYQPTNDVLFAKYYKPMPNLIDPIEKGSSVQTPTISQLYELGAYHQVNPSATTDSLRAFYQALAFIETDQLDRAQAAMNELAAWPNYRFDESVDWYVAMINLKSGNVEQVKEALAEIIGVPGHDYALQSQKLLDALQ